MKSINIDNQVVDFIQFHAKSNPNQEIYGWPIGYHQAESMNIIGAYSCHRYSRQSQVNAEPDPKELSQLSVILPHGINNLGLYHSHPIGVFHSHVDDRTFLDMARAEPELVSIVTNGEKTHYYQSDNGDITEITPKLGADKPALNRIDVRLNLDINKDTNKFKLASQVEEQVPRELSTIVDVSYEQDNYDCSVHFTFPLSYLDDSDGFHAEIRRRIYEIITNNWENIDQLNFDILDIFDIPFTIISTIDTLDDRVKLYQLWKDN